MRTQVHRFAVVGVVATLVHLIVGSTLIVLGTAPELANTIAFGAAFAFSFMGHHRYSFAQNKAPVQRALQRFTVVAMAAFLLNQSILMVLIHSQHYDRIASLIVSTGCAAVFSFLCARCWAFASASCDRDVRR